MNHEVIPGHNVEGNLGVEVEHSSFLTSALYREEVSASRSYLPTQCKSPPPPSKLLNNNKKRAGIYWLLKFRQGRKITPVKLSFDSVLKTEKFAKKKNGCPFLSVSILE